ncbi:MAG: carboxypeptidase regulatory-like domain-containing protein [Bacteroidetes bacterium]|nr:carboxypeptidase regulatory-like domain-containing protein [Bacteroidota bacterium]
MLLLLLPNAPYAQTILQTIRGTVVEKESHRPLERASVVLIGNSDTFETQTDSLGEFEFNVIPVGRFTIYISLTEFKAFARPDILVGSAKQVIILAELEEEIKSIGQVNVVQKRSNPAGTNNELVTVSGRQFTADQTSRYAGSLMDPSRMAGNFAGVSGTTSQRNDIVIRGNSPRGLLWRLEGIDIPNPNHFSSQGTTGGPVSILNNNNLANSDFLTGAFPAEYGNALSGVFDLKMREGNNRKREYTGQIGFNGIELGAEGPINKAKRSSYLAYYRYSTLGVFDKLGINLTFAGIPYYQDYSFKLSFPQTKTGNWSVTGLGGNSHVDLLAKKSDSSTINFGTTSRNNIKNGSSMAAYILGNTFRIKNGYVKSSVAFTRDGRFTKFDTLDINDFATTTYGEGSTIDKWVWHSFINKKLNTSNVIRCGVIYSFLQTSIRDSSMDDSGNFRILRNASGNSNFAQVYAEWKHNFGPRWILNSGMYSQYYFANKTHSIEPRIGMRYNLARNQSLAMGAGLHSQMQALEVYYGNTRLPGNQYWLSNFNLDFSKSIHAVFGYDNQLGRNLRLKVESYYQYLYQIPVSQTQNTYSVLNLGGEFGGIFIVDSLENNGKGRNYGLEITLEKFYAKNYYFLFTTSLFDSKYTAASGKQYNTAFNGKFVLNGLAGYEKSLGKRKRATVSANIKITYAGGRRYTPVDIQKTEQSGFIQYDWSRAYGSQFKNYFRTDLKVGLRWNGKKVTQEWALDIQNFFNTKNPLSLAFNSKTKSVYYEYQQGRLPIVFYRILF